MRGVPLTAREADMKSLTILIVAVCVGLATPSFATNCCVDGLCIYIGTLSTGTTPLNSLCSHTISGSGCTINMMQNESVTSGNCVTMQGSTTLNMNGHSIDCTTSACGIGVTVTHASSNNANQIKGTGTISGCWQGGAGLGGIAYTSNDTIQDVTVSLPASGCTTGYSSGLWSFKTFTRVVVGGATSAGLYAEGSSTNIADSIVHDNTGRGIWLDIIYGSGQTAGPTITGTLAVDNGSNLAAYTYSNTVHYNLTDSTVRHGTTCNFFEAVVGGGCVAATDLFRLSGVNFVDDTILH
jgi:hypothetical protein